LTARRRWVSDVIADDERPARDGADVALLDLQLPEAVAEGELLAPFRFAAGQLTVVGYRRRARTPSANSAAPAAAITPRLALARAITRAVGSAR
jgi:hypothetical protein